MTEPLEVAPPDRTAVLTEGLASVAGRLARQPGLVVVPLGMLAVAAAGRYRLGTKSLWFDEIGQ